MHILVLLKGKNVTNFLIATHVLFGSLAVLGMVTALATKKGSTWHRRGGKAYVYGMAWALIAAAIVSVLTSNAFLFSVGLFSAYLVYTGARLAVAKDGIRSNADKWIANFIVPVGGVMIAFGVYLFREDSSTAITLAVFGLITAAFGYADIKRGDRWPTGKERIVLHLGRMGGASIATITAVFVVNVETNPEFIAWLLPTVVGTVLIRYWTKRVNEVGI